MLTHDRPALSRGPANLHGFLWSLLASKPAKFAFSCLLVVTLLLIVLNHDVLQRGEGWSQIAGPAIDSDARIAEEIKSPGKGRLHLLVPATSSNPDLCKLLLSAQVLGYPTPVLINYGSVEDHEDVYKQHLAKVEGILNYLERLQSSDEYAEELVLIVDGYDMWFQLRPDVLIKRYYELNRFADNRARAVYGSSNFEKMDMRQTIIFGPDKLCWPVNYSRPACWAVPDAPLPDYAFGPETSKIHIDMFMPRWLNSGTIIGPVQDLLKLFEATLNLIHTKYETDSDQFYFAELFGLQEYARLTKRPDLLQRARETRLGVELASPTLRLNRTEPDMAVASRSEYHIGVDYFSSTFQTLAFYKQYLAFIRTSDSWNFTPTSQQRLGPRFSGSNRYSLELPEDIKASPGPLNALRTEAAGEAELESWSEVNLLYNTVTKQFPVLIHFTGAPEKSLRKFWWQKMSFQNKARELRLASQEPSGEPISPLPINRITWYNAEPTDTEDIAFKGRGGAWSDRGGWLSWNTLCKEYEGGMYDIMNEDFFHAPPIPDEEDQVKEEN